MGIVSPGFRGRPRAEGMQLPPGQYLTEVAERYGGLTAVETRVQALGATRRVLLTHSPSLHAKQAAGFDQTIAKATRALSELAAVLERGRSRRERPAVQAEIARITRPCWLDRVLSVQLTGDTPAQ